jgi:hypothetical protein
VSRLRPGGIVVIGTTPQDAGQLLPIQQYTLALLQHRFKLREVDTDGQGLQAFRMTALAAGQADSTTSPLSAPQPVLSVEPGCG